MKHNFRELKIWKRSMDNVIEVYKLTSQLPSEERFSLSYQINKSAVSVPSNIAESTSRISVKEICRFLDIAIGSAYELETQLILVSRLYPDLGETSEKLIIETHQIQSMIVGFKKKVITDDQDEIKK